MRIATHANRAFFSVAWITTLAIAYWAPHVAHSQDLGQEDIDAFDHFELGPWSEIERTTLTVPKVANGSVVLDGSPSSNEYGSFEAVEVVPVETGWVLNFSRPSLGRTG